MHIESKEPSELRRREKNRRIVSSVNHPSWISIVQ